MNNLKIFYFIVCFGRMQALDLMETGNNMYFSTCDLHPKRNPRIVGGLNSELNEMPFIVSLTRRGGHFCGATIINTKWLLTAGHCVCNGFNQFIKTNHIKGIVGLHQISNFQTNITHHNSSNKPIEIKFKNIVVHPDYNCNKHLNDIALLELSSPLKFNEQVQSACILKNENKIDYDNLMATIYGWGWTNENQEIGDRADILQKANVKIWNNEECQKSYENLGKHNLISKTQICAGFHNGGIDSCWADSGGPLLIDNLLIGIVSTGVGCGRPGLPGIYTRVNRYIKWIESETKSK